MFDLNSPSPNWGQIHRDSWWAQTVKDNNIMISTALKLLYFCIALTSAQSIVPTPPNVLEAVVKNSKWIPTIRGYNTRLLSCWIRQFLTSAT
jgi:hypothetical protein